MAAIANGATAGAARAASDTAADAFFQQAHALQVLQALHGFSSPPQWSQSVLLDLPETMDDGAVVPLTVRALFNDASEIKVLVNVNPVPLALQILIPQGTDAFLSTRIRMSASGTVYAAVRSTSGWFVNAQHVQVSAGGCR